jgi:Restriction endonuclease NotI
MNSRAMPAKPRVPAPRYGVAELYGHAFVDLSADQIRELSAAPFKSQTCPFRGSVCNKAGGVCTLRSYRTENGTAVPVNEEIVTVCPQRFREKGRIFSWAGEEILKCSTPTVIGEVPFLLGAVGTPEQSPDAVGQIDMVLVDQTKVPFSWCALEIQAVYFSGAGMTSQFNILKTWIGPGVPFPDKVRRPDFRSSGPKRLMPQLQIKVPTLRRWGKKMAVVVDQAFWQSLGTMDNVPDMSNCDVAWFVVRYQWQEGRFVLIPHELHLTTLERAVEGLTAGRPVSLDAFEAAIRARITR